MGSAGFNLECPGILSIGSQANSKAFKARPSQQSPPRFKQTLSQFCRLNPGCVAFRVWLRQMWIQATGGPWRKSTVYGLNGHRSNFVIALFLGGYEYVI